MSSVSVDKKIFVKSKSVEITNDVIVPDVKPDIVSLINTNGNAYIYKKEISGGRLKLEGNIDTYIVYLSVDGEIRSIGTSVNFTEFIEDVGIKDGVCVKEKVKIEKISAKVLNERKVSISAFLNVSVEGFETDTINFLDEFENINNAEFLKENLEIKSVIGKNSVKNSAKDSIQIDANDDVAEIIKTCIEISNKENKVSYNKVLLKADANVKIVYSTENGKIKVAQGIVPVMSFVDIEKVSEEHICEADYNIRNMLFKINSKEEHSITVQIDFEVNCEVYERKNLELIQDMYGLNEEVTCKNKEVEVLTCDEENSNIITIEENVLLEDISSILTSDASVKFVNFTKMERYVNCEGEILVNFLYLPDNGASILSKDVTFSFMYKIEDDNNFDNNLQVDILSSQFLVNSENVKCIFNLKIEKNTNHMKKISIIENVERKALPERNNYEIYVYFIKPGDSLWSISKKFRVSKEKLLKENEIENEESLTVGKKLYIVP